MASWLPLLPLRTTQAPRKEEDESPSSSLENWKDWLERAAAAYEDALMSEKANDDKRVQEMRSRLHRDYYSCERKYRELVSRRAREMAEEDLQEWLKQQEEGRAAYEERTATVPRGSGRRPSSSPLRQRGF